MRAPLKTALASWAPSINIIIIIYYYYSSLPPLGSFMSHPIVSVVFKTKSSHSEVENTPLKHINGKRKSEYSVYLVHAQFRKITIS